MRGGGSGNIRQQGNKERKGEKMFKKKEKEFSHEKI